jgi:hypothetical protein
LNLKREFVDLFRLEFQLIVLNIFSLPPPDLPTSQDCHELTSKRRRRELREQQAAALQSMPPKASIPAIKLSSIDLGPP